MRILHVVQSLDPAWGGIARVLPQLTSRLVAGVDACRIATLCGGKYGSTPDVPGVEVLRFTGRARCPLGSSPGFKAAIGDLTRDADVIHLHGLWTGQNRAAGHAARKLRRPYIMTPHSMMMPWAWRRSGWKKRPAGWLFEHRNLRNAACLHALAEGEAEHMRALGFNDRIEVIPNGVCCDDYVDLPAPDAIIQRHPELRDRKWVLFLGRLHPQKGIVPAMQACFDALASADPWHLVIAGPDEVGIQKTLQAAVTRKGLDDRVTFTGMLGREETLACLGRARILLQPSMSEGLSMSIVEALAAGTPVLISPACNMPEVQTAGAGRVVSPDRRAIAVALRELIALDDNALAALGRRARALARSHFGWAGLIPKYHDMYQRAAE